MAGCLSQVAVAVELGGQAGQRLGAVVVLEEKGQADVTLPPHAIAVGADHRAPFPPASSLGPPLLESGPRAAACRAGERGEEAVGAHQVGQPLARRQVVDEGAAPGRHVELEAGVGGHESRAEGTEGPVERAGLAPGLGAEAVEHGEGVQLGQAHAGPALAGEGDVGDLAGGEDAVLVEQAAQVAVALGDASEYAEEALVEVAPAVTARGGAGRR